MSAARLQEERESVIVRRDSGTAHARVETEGVKGGGRRIVFGAGEATKEVVAGEDVGAIDGAKEGAKVARRGGG